MLIPKRVTKLLEKWAATKGPQTHLASEQVDCDLCESNTWWAEHGYSEAERQFFCGPQGIQCPGFGDDPQN